MTPLTFAKYLGLALTSAFVIGGCGAPREQTAQEARDEAKRLADESKAVVTSNNNALGKGTVTTKNSTLQGNDAKGKLLWRLKFQEGRLHNSNGATSTRTGDLIGATAELFRNGKTESAFRAAKINFADSSKGLVMTMTGGVSVQTTGAMVKETTGKVNLSAPTVRVNVKARTMRAEGGVRMAQGQTTITAPQLAADTGLAIARAGGGVVATVPQGRIRAQNAVWNWTTRRVQATGQVEVSSAANGAKITGSQLDADTNASRGSLSGGVRATSSDGASASANQVLFNWSNNTIEAREDVTLQKDGAVIRAARVESDSQLNRAQATGGVTMQKDNTTITASGVEAFDKATRVVASGDVRVQRDGENLSAGRAEVWITEKRAIASGGVTLTRSGSTLRADNVQYWGSGGRAVANGNVAVTREGATLRSNSAQYWTSGKAIATGDVRLTRDDVTMQAPRLESENISDKARARVLASGGVVARGRGGEVRAQTVTWSNAGAVATGGVRLERQGNSLRGSRLQTDANFAKATLSGNVGGTLKNGATFSSATLQWTRLLNGKALANNGRIVGQGGVVLRQGELRMSGARLEASGDGRNATLTGGVVAEDSNASTVRAQSVRYDGASQKIFASGNVFYRDARGNSLRGTNLVAHLVGGSLKDATLNNVTGSGKTQIFSGKTLFGN